MATITTTLNKIRSFGPYKQGWEMLLASLDKTQADDEPLNYLQILESNGVQDTIWCMRCEWFEHKEVWMQFVASCKNAANAAADAAYTDVYDADAAAAAAADAGAGADAAAAAAAYVAAADAERTRQANFLRILLS